MRDDSLKLKLQFFAEKDVDDDASKSSAEDVDNKDNETGDGDKQSEKQSEEKTFTQAELEQILADRLARADRKREQAEQKAKDEAEKKRLEEQGEYKALLEKTQAQLAEYEQKEQQRVKTEKIVAEFKKHGLSQEQAEGKVKWVENAIEDDDQIESVVSEFANEFKTETYADPSAGFGKTKTPEPQDDEEYGQKMLDRVRGLTKTKYQ